MEQVEAAQEHEYDVLWNLDKNGDIASRARGGRIYPRQKVVHALSAEDALKQATSLSINQVVTGCAGHSDIVVDRHPEERGYYIVKRY